MNRIFLAFLLVTLCVSSAAAQDAAKKPAGTTRVATVNVGAVFAKYAKARLYKKELEDSMTSFKIHAKELADQSKVLSEALQKRGIEATEKEILEADLVENRRELEDMHRKVQKIVGKKQQDTLLVLWNDVEEGIKSYAMAHDIEVVLGYGEPIEKNVVNLFPNVNRKMQAMENGGVIPLFIARGVDISAAVAAHLNKQFEQDSKYDTFAGND